MWSQKLFQWKKIDHPESSETASCKNLRFREHECKTLLRKAANPERRFVGFYSCKQGFLQVLFVSSCNLEAISGAQMCRERWQKTKEKLLGESKLCVTCSTCAEPLVGHQCACICHNVFCFRDHSLKSE